MLKRSQIFIDRKEMDDSENLDFFEHDGSVFEDNDVNEFDHDFNEDISENEFDYEEDEDVVYEIDGGASKEEDYEPFDKDLYQYEEDFSLEDDFKEEESFEDYHRYHEGDESFEGFNEEEFASLYDEFDILHPHDYNIDDDEFEQEDFEEEDSEEELEEESDEETEWGSDDDATTEFNLNKDYIPGTNLSLKNEDLDQASDGFVEENENLLNEKNTDWEADRDPKHFESYLKNKLENIPQHSGNTTAGCERAITYLNALNKEISEAIKRDVNTVINLDVLEKSRDYIMSGVSALKKRISDLNNIKKASFMQEGFKKEAFIPQIDYVMTPFERAITGIIVNSVVSGGKPFDDVYNALNEHYKFTDREELAILQLIMDMGFPIYKDRGTIGKMLKDKDKDGYGMDFLKNYFA